MFIVKDLNNVNIFKFIIILFTIIVMLVNPFAYANQEVSKINIKISNNVSEMPEDCSHHSNSLDEVIIEHSMSENNCFSMEDCDQECFKSCASSVVLNIQNINKPIILNKSLISFFKSGLLLSNYTYFYRPPKV